MDSEGIGTGGREGEAAQVAPEITLLAAAVARTGAIPLMPSADNVVVLPDGASLDDVAVQGRDLVITLDDGRMFVIPDGAVYVPEIVVAGVSVPPLNLAALLIGNEPQPAAGAVQSSGGNFADPVGPIQAAYDLGDLLPYTELSFPQPVTEELFPAVVGNRPDVVIQDGGPASRDATDEVSEAGLRSPRAGSASESPGTLAGNGSDSTDGTIIITSPDGIASVTINGQLVTGLAGQTIVTDKGVLVLGALSGNEIPYVYTLADNTTGDTTTDVFNVRVTDPDGDAADARLTIVIADDVPTAVNDSATQMAEDASVTVAVLANDIPGADGVAPGTVAVVAGTLSGAGSLAVNPDGTITYTPGPGEEGTVTFDYTIQDGDGDPSRATVTITLLEDSEPSVSVSGEN
ncbi:MAG: lysis protein, partial [Sphingomonadales bacterium]|nr:lysis protein [Sphingomonadales bacterium]